MTISSSLNAGVTGLNANATRLAAISDNISNSATAGYKRVQTSFQSMVLGGTGAGSYAAGGVRASTMRLIEEGGTLISSSNPTDLAIQGRGFLPVTTETAIRNGGQLPMHMMTTGSFRPDTSGYLRNEAGMVLMGVPVNSDGTVPPFPRDSSGGLQPIRVESNQFSNEPTSRIGLGVNLPSTDTLAAGTDPFDLTVEYYTNLGAAERLNIEFAPTDPATPNAWTIRVLGSDNTVLATRDVTFSGAAIDGGRIVSGGDPISIVLNPGPNAQPVSIDVAQLTQLSDRFQPLSITKDGSPVGSLAGVEIDSQGMLKAVYDNGLIRNLALVPIVDVPNPNGMAALSGQVYRATSESGPFFLWNAGDGPVGTVEGFAREESTTDVAHELTQMIQTQRAYSSNAKVIQTVDEMLQETTNIKR
jgi:flagellar hook protein FlgE